MSIINDEVRSVSSQKEWEEDQIQTIDSFIKNIIGKCCWDCEGNHTKIKCIFRQNDDGPACVLDKRTKKQRISFIKKVLKEDKNG